MKTVTLAVNGSTVSAAVEPRLSLADFLRDHRLLTGTHIGCEHGICGACTVLIDGEPARSCIALAVACEGREVCTIEGLDDDPVAARLREAFKVEHGLQCGYCTPGMLVTARDIVQRLPDADADRVRLELSGNLCRCTGYAGIVRAICRVLADPPAFTAPRQAPALPELPIATATSPAGTASVARAPEEKRQPAEAGLRQTFQVALPRPMVWRAIKDPQLIASCVPGVSLDPGSTESRILGRMTVGLGPIRARFSGMATIAYDDAAFAGSIDGEGRDSATGTRLRATARFRASEAGPDATAIELAVDYVLQGALAQFGRGAIVNTLATELGQQVVSNLEARIAGSSEGGAGARPPLRAGHLLWRAIWARLRRLISSG